LAKTYCVKPEQSKPDGVVPPQTYFTPRYFLAVAITEPALPLTAEAVAEVEDEAEVLAEAETLVLDLAALVPPRDVEEVIVDFLAAFSAGEAEAVGFLAASWAEVSAAAFASAAFASAWLKAEASTADATASAVPESCGSELLNKIGED